MHLHIHPLHGLSQNTCNEDSQDCQWTYITDEEPEDAEHLCIAADGSAVGELVVHICLLEAPSDEEDGQETAKGHEDVRREIVEEVEKISAIDLHMREWAE